MIRRSVPILLLLAVVACSGAARQKTIRLTYESTNIAADQLETFTEVHAKAIVDEAKATGKTKEEVTAEVDAFLVKADHAVKTELAVYRMVAAAAALNDDQSLTALLRVAQMFTDELKELGVLK